MNFSYLTLLAAYLVGFVVGGVANNIDSFGGRLLLYFVGAFILVAIDELFLRKRVR